MTAEATAPLGDGDMLALLLGAEGFLFAAITLAVTLAGPNQPASRFEKLSPSKILVGAAGALLLVGVGATCTWARLYGGGDWVDITTAVQGGALLLAIVAQPILALLLTLASLD